MPISAWVDPDFVPKDHLGMPLLVAVKARDWRQELNSGNGAEVLIVNIVDLVANRVYRDVELAGKVVVRKLGSFVEKDPVVVRFAGRVSQGNQEYLVVEHPEPGDVELAVLREERLGDVFADAPPGPDAPVEDPYRDVPHTGDIAEPDDDEIPGW